jgi:hypothetical protein
MEVEVYADELAALDPFVAARRAMHSLREVLREAAEGTTGSLTSSGQDGLRRRGARPEGRPPP